MTIDELLAREAIRHTLAAYTMAGDGRRVDDFADCFTPDGLFRSPIFDLQGREAIRDWFRARAMASSAVRFVRHNLGTSLIQLQGEGEAEVRTYFTVFSDRGPDHGGIYLDRFRHSGKRWLIAERDIQTDWARADSLLVPPASRVGIAIVGGPDTV